jgi:hypothetical protein
LLGEQVPADLDGQKLVERLRLARAQALDDGGHAEVRVDLVQVVVVEVEAQQVEVEQGSARGVDLEILWNGFDRNCVYIKLEGQM